jgi:hypothetical protein
MVVVDKLKNNTYFILVNMTHKEAYIVGIYKKEIARLHGVPKVIVLYKDLNFTSKFWKRFFKGFGKI